VPCPERIPWSQFILSGEQNSPSGVHGSPLVTLCPPLAQVHRTVSPSEILTSLGSNVNPGPTCTSKIWPAGDRTPLTAGRPLWSTMWIAWAEACLCCPCAENANANVAASQKVSPIAVFDRFIFCFFNLVNGDGAQRFRTRQVRKAFRTMRPSQKGNRSVTWAGKEQIMRPLRRTPSNVERSPRRLPSHAVAIRRRFNP
jgi:hypothetical protein